MSAVVKIKPLAVFAEELADAFSTDRYRGGWGGCISMLRKRGYSDRQIEAIIRSKWPRWAGDMSDRAYGQLTSTDLAKFLDTMPAQKRSDAVLDLVAGTF